MDRVTQRLWRGGEGPRRCLITHAARSFSTTGPRHGFGRERLLSFEGYEDIRTAIAREKQLKGWRRAKKLKLIRSIHPEFKDLAQTWGWKMITVHEKMYP